MADREGDRTGAERAAPVAARLALTTFHVVLFSLKVAWSVYLAYAHVDRDTGCDEAVTKKDTDGSIGNG